MMKSLALLDMQITSLLDYISWRVHSDEVRLYSNNGTGGQVDNEMDLNMALVAFNYNSLIWLWTPSRIIRA